MKLFLKLFGVFFLAWFWNKLSESFVVLALFGAYPSTMCAVIFALVPVATIALIIWGAVYFTYCHIGRNQYWTVLKTKGWYVLTLIFFVLYMVVYQSSNFAVALGRVDKYDFLADNINERVVEACKWSYVYFLLAKYALSELVVLWVIMLIAAQYELVEKHRIESKEGLNRQKQQLAELDETLVDTNSQLLQMIKSKLTLTLRVRELALRNHDDSHLSSVPGVVVSDAQWDEFLSDYNRCSDGLLNRWKAQNPKLTDTDMLYMSLCRLEMTPRDISLLLGTSDRTVWNRRQVLKTHLDVEIPELDEWLNGNN